MNNLSDLNENIKNILKDSFTLKTYESKNSLEENLFFEHIKKMYKITVSNYNHRIKISIHKKDSLDSRPFVFKEHYFFTVDEYEHIIKQIIKLKIKINITQIFLNK